MTRIKTTALLSTLLCGLAFGCDAEDSTSEPGSNPASAGGKADSTDHPSGADPLCASMFEAYAECEETGLKNCWEELYSECDPESEDVPDYCATLDYELGVSVCVTEGEAQEKSCGSLEADAQEKGGICYPERCVDETFDGCGFASACDYQVHTVFGTIKIYPGKQWGKFTQTNCYDSVTGEYYRTTDASFSPTGGCC